MLQRLISIYKDIIHHLPYSKDGYSWLQIIGVPDLLGRRLDQRHF